MRLELWTLQVHGSLHSLFSLFSLTACSSPQRGNGISVFQLGTQGAMRFVPSGLLEGGTGGCDCSLLGGEGGGLGSSHVSMMGRIRRKTEQGLISEVFYVLKTNLLDTWKHFSSVQSLSHVQLFENPWTAARQASLSITNSWSLLKLISMESVMP